MAQGKCLLFLGPEIGERQDAVQEIRAAMHKQYGTPPEEQSFYAGETPLGDIVSVLRNGCLFSDARLIQIKNIESLKKKEETELLASYMESPQEDTVLILVSEQTSADKRLEKAVPPNNKRIFWELFENRKAEWVSGFFRREGYTIEEDGIEAILEMVENNTDALRRECSRLMLFLGKDSVIRGEDVEQWLSHSREESAFTLFARISEGNLEKSLEILRTLLAAKESPQAILAGLSWCFHKLRDYLLLTQSGMANDFEYKKIGLGSSRVRKDYSQAARRYSLYCVDRCIALLAEFDILIRSGGTALEHILLDVFLYKIILVPGTSLEKVHYY
ncbi:DNA polymerase III subunit delta [Breznakiella homolactica]|uniref:DNA polymerase III subunit delta n=1 Tax=Breznakiella homolactica TaxID=2798577 RepID=A0A7T7XQ89_9SPIR|nr:DNA polymerase III subunit delta [Breznakiella homolactica]QQO10510.1 DNA polymerase III subunit delta [Breznakiella homolactica]